MSSHTHSHDGISHAHPAAGDHGHSHEILDGPGSYLQRELPIVEGRDWNDRAFTVGIGGHVSFPPFQASSHTLLNLTTTTLNNVSN